jgi:agmatinase
MDGETTPTFLGLEESEFAPWDVVLLQIPFEMTTSYREGTEFGPAACIEASSQVELFDPILPSKLPCGMRIHTTTPWSSEAPTLLDSLDSIRDYVAPWMNGEQFPIVLGGEHGILPPLMAAVSNHPALDGDLSKLTLIQIDAHADLRDELNEERFSHGTVIRRSLDAGVGKVIQIGVRAYCEEEAAFIESDERVETWFAKDLFSASINKAGWKNLIQRICDIEGVIWLTFDIDGLDGSLVPATGTPVPGGLAHWGAVEIIEKLFSNKSANVIGADVNEISTSEGTNLTEFSAALVATKILAAHIAATLAQIGE